MAGKENLHEGHRERALDEILAGDNYKNFSEHRILEALLFYAVPRKDTNELAHRLLGDFGSLNALLDASDGELEEIPYITKRVRQYFRMISVAMYRYNAEKYTPAMIFSEKDELETYLRQRTVNENEEVMSVAYFNAKGRLLHFEMFKNSKVNGIGVDVKSVVKRAIAKSATGVVLAHNHPSGNATPSEDDIEATTVFKNALNPLGIDVIDHYIFSEKDKFVFSEHSSTLRLLISEDENRKSES